MVATPTCAVDGYHYLYAIAALVFWSATRSTGDRSRLVDPGILSPLGVVFGLLIVFTAAQVWGDLAQANSAVADEASAGTPTLQ